MVESEEKALANARQFMWMQGEFTGLQHPVWAAPSGYLGPWARRALAEVHVGRRPNPAAGAPFEKQVERMLIVAGTPGQVVQKLRVIMEETRPSILALWGNDGNVRHEDASEGSPNRLAPETDGPSEPHHANPSLLALDQSGRAEPGDVGPIGSSQEFVKSTPP
jgi:hypothetical protein